MTSPVIGFRLATADDVEVVQALVQGAYRGESSRAGWTTEADLLDGVRMTVEEIAAIVRGDDSDVLLALDEQDEIVGCVALHLRSPELAYLGMFAVRPTMQGRGVGRHVVGQAESLVRERWGVGRMEMTVIGQRVDLIAWYERLGYARTVETRPFPHTRDALDVPQRPDLYFVVLEKSLLAPPSADPVAAG